MGNLELTTCILVFINIICLIFYLVVVVKISQDGEVNLKLFFIDFCVALSTFFMLYSKGLYDVSATMFAMWCFAALSVMCFLNS